MTCSPKKLKRLNCSRFMSPQKIVMHPTFLVPTLTKNWNGYIIAVIWLLKDVMVTSFSLQIYKNETVMSFSLLGSKKGCWPQKIEQLNPQLPCL
jgi:hypothetical protein